MDKFKIFYRCTKAPGEYFGYVTGFQEESTYEGRTFNGLIEISPNWGRSRHTKVISSKEFSKFFEIVMEQNVANVSAVNFA